MTRSFQIVLAAAIAVLALTAAGCGDDDGAADSTQAAGGIYGSGGGTATTEASTSGGAAATVISVASAGDLGDVLVDSAGYTLYLFEADEGGESACYETCQAVWLPLLTGGDTEAGDGADSSLLGTADRQDGTTQVTYDGWPLYTYDGDEEPGEANGNGLDTFGGEWYAVHADGSPAG